MIESLALRWLAQHWKGLLAGALALLLVPFVLLAGGGQAGAFDDDATCGGESSAPVSVDLPDLDAEQRLVVGSIIQAGRDLNVPANGIVIALMVSAQEAFIWHNPGFGDGAGPDSRGAFQQRSPWGPEADRMDPYKAARMFYTGGQGGQPGLLDVPGWPLMEPTLAANAVQRSAHPYLYAKHQARSMAVYAAVMAGGGAVPTTAPVAAQAAVDPQAVPFPTGVWNGETLVPEAPAAGTASPSPTAPAVLTDPSAACASVPPGERGPDGTWPPEGMGPDGLTPRTKRVDTLVRSTFGETNIGGYAGSGHVPGSDHYTGNAIDVMILPWTDPVRVEQGERISAWLLLNWDSLAIKYVIYRKRITTDGVTWRPYSNPIGSGVTLDHWDHVHVSVH